MSQKIFKNAKKLGKNDLKEIIGGVSGPGTPDLSQCGCSCTGAVTGPAYCSKYKKCLQVMTC
ncbi:hypothetical protein C1637_17420 [Chryseobacterium lactis]|uniref:Bacteriocin n=1 Tax=Chryseobacterium lactis TaxID=1241981 RepID=A0A3G6RNC2_CHRLC|nr:hypothetical protein [Chryseobacterium lactis]AZA82983.1 hypothetical protein EG342_14330 [Chryseobacterium lactis]AZB03366.1 hypothetical protein EG341_05195 [Chryseobacterium lactis]PNW12348.1 hypothetical protein C1637_17420 [Chryseobacterium lactis]